MAESPAGDPNLSGHRERDLRSGRRVVAVELGQVVLGERHRKRGGVGADIIVDDLGFFGEPYFEDGPIAQTVDTVRANGTIYITAAGNEALEHYEADFVRGGTDQKHFQTTITRSEEFMYEHVVIS